MNTHSNDSATLGAETPRRRTAKSKGGRKSARSKAKPASKPKAAAKPKTRRENKKTAVIDLMRRPGGSTLGEIMETTGWQKHTVRGFVSLLGRKGGEKIESAKNATGERTYRVAK